MKMYFSLFNNHLCYKAIEMLDAIRKYKTKHDLLDLAILAAKNCAHEISHFLEPTIVSYKSIKTNPVSAADKAGEKVISRTIKAERPSDGIIGEEGSNKKSNNGLRWVFDPLDGTINYLYRIPHWGISIACEKFNGSKWTTIVGVVYDVLRNEIFTAIREQGAEMNGTIISVNNNTEYLSDALIATEFSYIRENRNKQAKTVSDILLCVKDIRCSGSSALDLCWVASGRLDGFYENELSRWDWSAASLIVEEAGGIVSQFGTGVIASPPRLHEPLSTILKPQ